MSDNKFTSEQIAKAVEVLKKVQAQKKAFREAVASGNYEEYVRQQEAEEQQTPKQST